MRIVFIVLCLNLFSVHSMDKNPKRAEEKIDQIFKQKNRSDLIGLITSMACFASLFYMLTQSHDSKI